MSGFKGQATYSIDAKGRVAVPAKMRACMSTDARETFVITRGFEECIYAYPLDRWRDIEREIEGLNPYNRQDRAFTRRFLRWAEEVVLDKKGRIAIHRPLIEYAGINQNALILGSQRHIEFWDPQKFDEYLAAEEADYETLATQVMGG